MPEERQPRLAFGLRKYMCTCEPTHVRVPPHKHGLSLSFKSHMFQCSKSFTALWWSHPITEHLRHQRPCGSIHSTFVYYALYELSQSLSVSGTVFDSLLALSSELP